MNKRRSPVRSCIAFNLFRPFNFCRALAALPQYNILNKEQRKTYNNYSYHF